MATLTVPLGGTTPVVGSSGLPASTHPMGPMDTRSPDLETGLWAAPWQGGVPRGSTRGPQGAWEPMEEMEPGGVGERSGAVDAWRRLERRSGGGCGTGLPAHSPVTAGEEAASRPGDGEVTLRALFSQSVTMPGCP